MSVAAREDEGDLGRVQHGAADRAEAVAGAAPVAAEHEQLGSRRFAQQPARRFLVGDDPGDRHPGVLLAVPDEAVEEKLESVQESATEEQS